MSKCLCKILSLKMKWILICIAFFFLLFGLASFTWEFFLFHHGYEIDVLTRQWFPCFYDDTDLMMKIEPVINNSWEIALENYEKHRNPKKFVIFVPIYWQGLCNRILNSISILMFAMATNRTLWIEWESLPPVIYENVEIIGMMGFEELFQSNITMSKPKTIYADYWPHELCVTQMMQFGNLQSLDMYDIIHINRHDFWGTNVVKNYRYKDTVFNGLDVYKGFPFLMKKLFALKKETEAKNCSWLIHYRTQWPPPYHTAPFNYFIKCANQSGLLPQDYSTTYIISDNPMLVWETSSESTQDIIKKMNMPRSRVTSRGKHGDKKAMQQMYELSNCQNAILSMGSSYGACIAGLANIKNWHKVAYDGSCMKVTHGLVDANCNAKYGCMNTYLVNQE